jgi:hypothetical protein
MPTRISATLRTLDARPDRLDLRDRAYLPPVASLPPRSPTDEEIAEHLPAYVTAGLILDQKSDGACTGFGLACVIHYLLWRSMVGQAGTGKAPTVALDRVSTRMLYHLARVYDEWPGEDYDGSSCRGALKAWHKHGVCSERLWPYLNAKKAAAFVAPSPGWDIDACQRRLGVYYRIDHRSVVDMQAAIRDIGAIYVSADVHDGWDTVKRTTGVLTGHAGLPVISPVKRKASLGGHAFALVGYNPTGFVVQNSWGTGWGYFGFAVLPYDDWVKHGSDAWAGALGVPAERGAASHSVLAPSGSDATRRAATVPSPPVPRRRAGSGASNPSVEPWTFEKAYQHTVVLGNDGRPINRLVAAEHGAASVTTIVATSPAEWFAARKGPRRIAIYAHGGLNAEDGSMKRVQVLAPYFEANGIYPLFVAWKTGVLESLTGILEDHVAHLPRREEGIRDVFGRVLERAADVLDRTIEVASRPVVKPIWGQMKQNAEASADAGRGSVLIAEQLAALARHVGPVELHLVGHSAGSILLGHFLDAARRSRLSVKSCSLFAPACTVSFATTHYRAGVEAGVLRKRDLHIHLLSDRREREDTVGPYRKSLLYLVSRALETVHKTPLLGLAMAFDRSPEAIDAWNEEERQHVRAWHAWWKDQDRDVLDATHVRTGPNRRIKAAHGCFDNDVDTITKTLTRILGASPAHPVRSLDY